MSTKLKKVGQIAFQRLLDGGELSYGTEEFSLWETLLGGTEDIVSPDESFQEYCAAYYLTSLLEDEEQSFRDHLEKIESVGVQKMISLLQFSCGLSERAANLILSHEMMHSEDKAAQILTMERSSTKLAFKLKHEGNLECEGLEELTALGSYLESNMKPPPTTLNVLRIKCKSLQDIKALAGILENSKGDFFKINIMCFLSDQGNEMLQLLEETLTTAERVLVSKRFTDRLCTCVTICIDDQSHYDARALSVCITGLSNHIWNIKVGGTSQADCCTLIDALQGCSLYSFSVCGVDMLSRVAALGSLVTLSLKQLTLSSCRLQDDDIDSLINILPAGHAFIYLDLSDNEFSLDAVKALIAHCRSFPYLCHVSLTGTGLNEDHIKQMLQQDLPQLERNNEIGLYSPFRYSSCDDIRGLKQRLQVSVVNPSHWLRIEYTLWDKGNEEAELLEKEIGKLDRWLQSRLELILIVGKLYHSTFDVERLAGSIGRISKQVERFVLNLLRHQEEIDATRILNALSGGYSLKRLEVLGVSLQGRVADIHPQVITPSMEGLSLRHCQLNDNDIESLISLLPAGHGLTELDIPFNNFSKEAMETLSTHLQSFPNLD
ncbi:uncharacterized protein LOC110978623 isoform X2 [Acanthaster planci]|nr:uncharacterized protein LOC110978623 isoform X2 [Acanthaster planci]